MTSIDYESFKTNITKFVDDLPDDMNKQSIKRALVPYISDYEDFISAIYLITVLMRNEPTILMAVLHGTGLPVIEVDATAFDEMKES